MIAIERIVEAVPDTEDLDELLVADMVTRAIAFIEEQTGQRYFREVEEFTEYIYGFGTRNMLLRHIPVGVVGSGDEIDYLVSLEERAYAGGTAAVLTTADYEVRTGGRESWLVRLGGGVWTNGYEYRATYLRGYEVDGLPPDIEGLVLDLIAAKLGVRGAEGLKSEAIGGYSFTRFGASDLDGVAGGMATIEAWRRHVFA